MRLSLVILLLTVFGMTLAAPNPQFWNRVSRGFRRTGNKIASGARSAVDFTRGFAHGTRDMHRAYTDMKEANYKNSDKFFHARGNRDAAGHGAGGRFAAKVISDAREFTDRFRGGTAAQSAADQAANRLGRKGGNINIYRPKGLPAKYN